MARRGRNRGFRCCTLYSSKVLLDPRLFFIINSPLGKCGGTFTVLKRCLVYLVRLRITKDRFSRQLTTGKLRISRATMAEEGEPLTFRSICRIVTRRSQQFGLTGTNGAEYPLTLSNTTFPLYDRSRVVVRCLTFSRQFLFGSLASAPAGFVPRKYTIELKHEKGLSTRYMNERYNGICLFPLFSRQGKL